MSSYDDDDDDDLDYDYDIADDDEFRDCVDCTSTNHVETMTVCQNCEEWFCNECFKEHNCDQKASPND